MFDARVIEHLIWWQNHFSQRLRRSHRKIEISLGLLWFAAAGQHSRLVPLRRRRLNDFRFHCFEWLCSAVPGSVFHVIYGSYCSLALADAVRRPKGMKFWFIKFIRLTNHQSFAITSIHESASVLISLFPNRPRWKTWPRVVYLFCRIWKFELQFPWKNCRRRTLLHKSQLAAHRRDTKSHSTITPSGERALALNRMLFPFHWVFL